MQSTSSAFYCILIEDVELLGRGVLLEKLGCDLALGSKNDAVLGEDTNGGTSMRDGLERIFNLVESTLG